jgi:transcriptional regulator with GAF, ATPase, and Fis domain
MDAPGYFLTLPGTRFFQTAELPSVTSSRSQRGGLGFFIGIPFSVGLQQLKGFHRVHPLKWVNLLIEKGKVVFPFERPYRKEAIMRKEIMNYEVILKITKAVAMSRDPEEVSLLIVESVKTALEAKGCSLLIFNRKTNELELVASHGLSKEYLNKGPLSAIHSIADSLKDGPVAISDVTDDPRIQYPDEAKKEGISSILSVPIIVQEKPLGALRVYSAEPWEVSLEEVNLVQAIGQIAGMALEMARLYKGLKDSIELLKATRDPRTLKTKKWTPYEGVPKSAGRVAPISQERP